MHRKYDLAFILWVLISINLYHIILSIIEKKMLHGKEKGIKNHMYRVLGYFNKTFFFSHFN